MAGWAPHADRESSLGILKGYQARDRKVRIWVRAYTGKHSYGLWRACVGRIYGKIREHGIPGILKRQRIRRIYIVSSRRIICEESKFVVSICHSKTIGWILSWMAFFIFTSRASNRIFTDRTSRAMRLYGILYRIQRENSGLRYWGERSFFNHRLKEAFLWISVHNRKMPI